MLFEGRPYSSLEPLENRQFAVEDPNGFLDSLGPECVIDEVQRAPDLLSYIQPRVDAARRPGQYILTGSQNLLLLESVSQSLAGRTALASLLPFTLQEAYGTAVPGGIEEVIFRGFSPRTKKTAENDSSRAPSSISMTPASPAISWGSIPPSTCPATR
jgi:hypothetical protein